MMREVEFAALTDWLADGAAAAAGTAEAELAADWSRVVSTARWARHARPGLTENEPAVTCPA